MRVKSMANQSRGKGLLGLALVGGLMSGGMAVPSVAHATFDELAKDSKTWLDFRLRFESVEQNNALMDADGLTLRTRLGIETGKVNGFWGLAEFVDVAPLMGQDYDSGLNGKTTYSKIVDPKLTAVNQAYGGYAAGDTTVKLGRQRIILDNARFLGNVGWRQKEQTYDALAVVNTSLPDTTAVFGHIWAINGITGGHLKTSSNALNVSYSGLGFGKLTGYAYLLDVEAAPGLSSATYGVRFSGAAPAGDVKLLYTAEFATQSDSADNPTSYDADYTFLEGGVAVGGVTIKGGYEVLGSDNGTIGFQTPLATKHAFNGWTDQFLGTPANGLEDLYILATTKVAGIKLLGVYHTYESNEGSFDYGDEFGFLAVKKFGKTYTAGLKYSSYSADTWKVDTDKLWIWGEARM